jgi:hypothetical protein
MRAIIFIFGGRGGSRGWWISETLLNVTSLSVNVSTLGCDSLSKCKPWILAVRFPNPLTSPYVKSRYVCKKERWEVRDLFRVRLSLLITLS